MSKLIDRLESITTIYNGNFEILQTIHWFRAVTEKYKSLTSNTALAINSKQILLKGSRVAMPERLRNFNHTFLTKLVLCLLVSYLDSSLMTKICDFYRFTTLTRTQ